MVCKSRFVLPVGNGKQIIKMEKDKKPELLTALDSQEKRERPPWMSQVLYENFLKMVKETREFFYGNDKKAK